MEVDAFEIRLALWITEFFKACCGGEVGCVLAVFLSGTRKVFFRHFVPGTVPVEALQHLLSLFGATLLHKRGSWSCSGTCGGVSVTRDATPQPG